MNIAIIPARGGSTRIPGKNKRLFHGKPILAHSIDTARRSKLFHEIVVSTDDQDIVAIAKAYGAKVHMRPAAYCRNEVGTQEVMKIALRWWSVCHPNRLPELACCIYATAPLMTEEDLKNGLNMLKVADEPYVHSAGLQPPELWDGDQRTLHTDAGQWYWGRAKAFLAGTPLQGNTQHWVLPEGRVCDINTEEDWQRAERMYDAMKKETHE